MIRRPPRSTRTDTSFPTRRSSDLGRARRPPRDQAHHALVARDPRGDRLCPRPLELRPGRGGRRSEEHTSELQSLMRTSYAVFCLNKKQQPPQYTLVIANVITQLYIKCSSTISTCNILP